MIRKRRKSRASGQATTEYVILIAVLAALIFTVGSAFQKKMRNLVENQIGDLVAQKYFNPTRLHQYSFTPR